MSRISIDIADDLLLALREQPQDVVQEMRVSAALHYFKRDAFPWGKRHGWPGYRIWRSLMS
jgi:predicted secreted protein